MITYGTSSILKDMKSNAKRPWNTEQIPKNLINFRTFTTPKSFSTWPANTKTSKGTAKFIMTNITCVWHWTATPGIKRLSLEKKFGVTTGVTMNSPNSIAHGVNSLFSRMGMTIFTSLVRIGNVLKVSSTHMKVTKNMASVYSLSSKKTGQSRDPMV
jgi:hypothetical protein